MLDLAKVFRELPIPRKNFLSAHSIGEFYKIAKNHLGVPLFLIKVEPNLDRTTFNQMLFNIEIRHDVKCKLEKDLKTENQFYTTISYVGKDYDLIDYFLGMIEVMLDSINKQITSAKLEEIIKNFIELFRGLNEPSKKSIQGLWGELLVILNSNYPENFINSWHNDNNEIFDFSFPNFKIEVKTSSNDSRVHHFSFLQLNSLDNQDIFVASIKVRKSIKGIGVKALLSKIRQRVDTIAFKKLQLVVMKSLNSPIEKYEDILFDLEYSKASLAFYNSNQIPKITIADIPNGVSNIKFTSDLQNVSKLDQKFLDNLFTSALDNNL